MHIFSNFDSGNIQIRKINGNNAELEIRKDHKSKYFQWFYFKCVSERGSKNKFSILNAGKSSYPKGWKSYQAVASYDQKKWFRIPTKFDGEKLIFSLDQELPIAYFACFAPYTLNHYADLFLRCQQHREVTIDVLGEAIDGRPVELLRIGKDTSKKKCWVTARMHPGEAIYVLTQSVWT